MAIYKKWTSEDKDFIKNNHDILSDKELATKLSTKNNQNITISMIRRQRRALALDKKRGRPSKIKITTENNEKI